MALDLPSTPARTVADLAALVLACRPGVDARGRGRGVMISPVEEHQLGELAAAHGVAAVEAVLLKHCGGAERPVTMAAARLAGTKAGPQRAHRDHGIYEAHGVERPAMREVAAGDF